MVPDDLADPVLADPVDTEEVAGLKRRLARVLTGDDHEMMAPPSAGVGDRVWASMPDGDRARFTRIQLRKLDPRLLPRLIVRRSRRRSIRSGF